MSESQAPGIITERWTKLDAVSLAVVQRVVPGVGLISMDLTSGLPHQWLRRGMATSDAPTQFALKANEGQSSVVAIVDTIRFGKISAWLVRTKFINPENRYDPSDPVTQIMEYEQLWQESPLPNA